MTSSKKRNQCPSCEGSLDILPTDIGNLIICDKCFGNYVSVNSIKKIHGDQEYRKLMLNSNPRKKNKKIICIKCKSIMKSQSVPFPKKKIDLESCETCGVLWLEKDDIEFTKPLVCDMQRFIKEEKVVRILDEIEREKIIQAKLAEENLNIWHSKVKMKTKELDLKSKSTGNVYDSGFLTEDFVWDLDFNIDFGLD